jgi:hypothetical protein
VVVAETIIHALEKLDLGYPKLDTERRAELKKVRAFLQHEK